MRHFHVYPNVNFSDHLATNIMVRGKLRGAILNNVTLYYKYHITDDMTAELISQKYYGSAEYVWAIYYANDIHHPTFDWPMTERQFEKYLIEKYGSISKAQQKYDKTGKINDDAIHHYLLDGQYIVDKQTYLEYGYTQEYGKIVPVSFYEHEQQVNDRKREIVIIDKGNLFEIVNQFRTLFSN
jgi:Base plate wedge protein 53